MKVYLQYKALDESGKCKFLSRLIPALAEIGVEVTRKAKGADICLGMSRWRDEVPSMPRVLRVDGIYYHPKDKREKWRNYEIRKSIKKAHGVIFQSRWSCSVVCRLFDVKPVCVDVIHNGVTPEELVGNRGVLTKQQHDILMVSNWGSKKERLDKHLDWHLWVAGVMGKASSSVPFHFHLVGDTPFKVKETRYLTVHGRMDRSELAGLYNMCDALLYLSTPDCCPNTVVEALVAGLPVICIAGCGVEELVCARGECDGAVCEKHIDVPSMLVHMRNMGWPRVERRDDLYISTVALRYKQMFQRVLHECA